MGGVPLGNEFEVITDEDAYAMDQLSLNRGTFQNAQTPINAILSETDLFCPIAVIVVQIGATTTAPHAQRRTDY